VAVVFLYQITVFYNKTQQHHFWNFILMTQCKLCTRAAAAAAAAAVNKERSPMGRWARCSIYRALMLFSVPRDGNHGLENAIFRP